jgi:hypothetical protein
VTRAPWIQGGSGGPPWPRRRTRAPPRARAKATGACPSSSVELRRRRASTTDWGGAAVLRLLCFGSTAPLRRRQGGKTSPSAWLVDGWDGARGGVRQRGTHATWLFPCSRDPSRSGANGSLRDFAGALPSPAARGFPGKGSGKRIAGCFPEPGADGLMH